MDDMTSKALTWTAIRAWYSAEANHQQPWYWLCEVESPFFFHEEWMSTNLQYIPRNMHTVFALLCFVVVIHWLIFSYQSGLLHWHCGNLTIAPVPAKQPWWIWANASCEFIMNDYITTTKQSTTKPCANFLGYTVPAPALWWEKVGKANIILYYQITMTMTDTVWM